jgi:hypothetical protein
MLNSFPVADICQAPDIDIGAAKFPDLADSARR